MRRAVSQGLPCLLTACAVWWLVGSPQFAGHRQVLPAAMTPIVRQASVATPVTGPLAALPRLVPGAPKKAPAAPQPAPAAPQPAPAAPEAAPPAQQPRPLPTYKVNTEIPPELAKRWNRWGQMQATVRDGRDGSPLADAEVVVVETGQRMRTDKDGKAPVIRVPMIRDPRYEPIIAELHGQLTLVVYKNGYRDGVEFGIRIHENMISEPTVFMLKITDLDRRIEPHDHHQPFHHIWLLELTNQFRSSTQPGEGEQSPERG